MDEYARNVFSNWTENLYVLNARADGLPDRDGREAFMQVWTEKLNNERGLSRWQQFSEQSFTMACWGIALGVEPLKDVFRSKSKPYAEEKKSSGLFHAWRCAVARDGGAYQRDMLEDILKRTIARFGEDAAVKAFPPDRKASRTLEQMNDLKCKLPVHLDRILRAAVAADAAEPGAGRAPRP